MKNGIYKEHGKCSSKIYTYSREDENERLLVVCSFTKDNVKFKAPKGFDMAKAELLLSNYENTDSATIKPYECRVYRWTK